MVFSLITDINNDFFVFGEFKIEYVIKFQKNIIKLALMILVKVTVIQEGLLKLPFEQTYSRSLFADCLKIM